MLNGKEEVSTFFSRPEKLNYSVEGTLGKRPLSKRGEKGRPTIIAGVPTQVQPEAEKGGDD